MVTIPFSSWESWPFTLFIGGGPFVKMVANGRPADPSDRRIRAASCVALRTRCEGYRFFERVQTGVGKSRPGLPAKLKTNLKTVDLKTGQRPGAIFKFAPKRFTANLPRASGFLRTSVELV